MLTLKSVQQLTIIPAPEGRSSLAQRFSAGFSGKNDPSPGGTAQFFRSLVSPRKTIGHAPYATGENALALKFLLGFNPP